LAADAAIQTEPTVEPRPLVLERTEQSLTALYNVIKIFPDATLQTLNRYKLLFYFMRVDESPGVQMAALNVIHLVVANKVGGRACPVLSAAHFGLTGNVLQ